MIADRFRLCVEAACQEEFAAAAAALAEAARAFAEGVPRGGRLLAKAAKGLAEEAWAVGVFGVRYPWPATAEEAELRLRAVAFGRLVLCRRWDGEPVGRRAGGTASRWDGEPVGRRAGGGGPGAARPGGPTLRPAAGDLRQGGTTWSVKSPPSTATAGSSA